MLGSKIKQAKQDLNVIDKYATVYSSASETYDYMSSLDGISLRLTNITEFILDTFRNINSDKKLLLEKDLEHIIRHIRLSQTEKIVLHKLRVIEVLTKDYVNAEVYKVDIAEFFSDNSHRKSLKNIINKIEVYLNEKNINNN